MDKKLYEEFKEILRSELVPALGCTEPGAIACAAAEAGKPVSYTHLKRFTYTKPFMTTLSPEICL